MSVWVIEKVRGRSPRSVATDVYVMAGFQNSDHAYGFWETLLAPEPHRLFKKKPKGVIYTPEDYKKNEANHFFDMTGGAQVIQRISTTTYQMGVLDKRVAKLIASKVLIVNVDDYSDESEEMVVHTDRLQALPKINDMINTSLLLGNGYHGAYIYQINREDSRSRLDVVVGDYIDKPGANILFMYSDPNISTIRRTESFIWDIPHESFVISDDSIMEVSIERKSMSLTLAGQNYAKTCLIEHA